MNCKYLLNSLDTSVRDNLLGLALTNPNVQLAEHVDAIVSRNYRSRQDGVVLVSGGGAGHEPMFAGYVGPRLLTAAVSGSYFASPSAGQIIKLVEEIAKPETAVLLIVANYTGDRLNFGLAREYLTFRGYRDVRLFIFGDDLAPLLSNDPPEDVQRQRRGLAGIAFIHRIAGILSEQGQSLDEIECRLGQLSKLIYTISISLSACDIPGHGASFQLSPDQMELGLGVHGESGVKRVPLMSASETVNLMATELVNYLNRNGLLERHSGRVALIINKLGGITQIEMNIILKEVIEHMAHLNVSVVRLYHGCVMTSFNMKGFSLSALLLDDDLLHLLDQTESPTTITTHSGSLNTDHILRMVSNEKGVQVDESVRVDQYCEPSLYREVVGNACRQMITHEHELNQLDETVGDSDCGSTLSAIAKLLLDQIIKSRADQPPSFATLARLVSDHIGGTSGALYSLLFTSASNYIKVHREAFVQSLQLTSRERAQCWLGLLRHCIDRVSTYSGARVKDRSMIDALYGMQIGLEKGLALDGSTRCLCRLLAESTWTHARQTASMRARVGRAAYVNESHITRPDAGAIGVAIWTQALVDTLQQTLPPSP